MNFPPNVLRWQAVTRSEIERGGYPFPVEYALSVCLIESRGKVGIVNPNSGASGLMQIMPGTLDGYNQNNSPKIPLSHLRNDNAIFAPEQMRVGLWVMGRYTKNAYKWISKTNPNPPLSDLMRIADLMYVAGPGRVKKGFSELSDRTFDNMMELKPNWLPKSKPFNHPLRVWKWTTVKNDPTWDMDAIDAWVTGNTEPPPLPPPTVATQNGLIGALLLLAVASYFFSRQNK